MIEILKADFVDYYFLFEYSVFWDPKGVSACKDISIPCKIVKVLEHLKSLIHTHYVPEILSCQQMDIVIWSSLKGSIWQLF